jgi:hypothetical protein
MTTDVSTWQPVSEVFAGVFKCGTEYVGLERMKERYNELLAAVKGQTPAPAAAPDELTTLERASRVFKHEGMNEHLRNLWGRWQEEKQSEDFATYIKSTQALLAHVEPKAKFVSLTKRPFTLTFMLGQDTYYIKNTASKSVLQYRQGKQA